MLKAKFGKQLTISLKPEVYMCLKDLSDQQEVSIAETTRLVIEKGLKEESNHG
jgi:predicted DNA-binding protein